MFKYSAFTENTPEMREYLESIGYKSVIPYTMPILYTFVYDGIGYYQSTLNSDNAFNIIKENTLLELINCIGNPALFKAVTAVRDDSDYMQWFYNSYYNNWNRCELGDAIDYFYLFWMTHARKASLVELQEHFNN